MDCDIKDTSLAPVGKKRIEWADQNMPTLREITQRFQIEKPFKGLRISACLHVTAETANLMRALKAGGARVVLCASNPLSTQDSVAAALVLEYGISVFAIHGEDTETYYKHLNSALEHSPHITLDDGADLISEIHTNKPQKAKEILASLEETTTGVIRLKALENAGKLLLPVIAVNNAKTKNLFDNRYGTGQSTVDGIIRATGALLAGKNMIIAGYGWCGKGLAMRARGMGAHVIVTEVDAIKALEATMDGFRVMTMADASEVGDIFCTVTGNRSVIRKEHFMKMKDGAIVCNSGHFDVEIEIPTLRTLAQKTRQDVRPFVDEYELENGNKIYLLAEGRLVNLAAAEGHPASVMDMSFATQALCSEFVVKNSEQLIKRVYDVPRSIEETVATMKLNSMHISIDTLTHEQTEYLSSWNVGT